MVDFDLFINNISVEPIYDDISDNINNAKQYYNNNNYLELINEINDISNSIYSNPNLITITNPDVLKDDFNNNIINPLQDILEEKINNNMEIINQSEQYDSSSVNDFDNILNNNDLRKTQQTENKNIFLNKYLYVIIKLIFIIILFIICFFLLKSNISFNTNFSTIFSSLNNRITNKIDNIKQKSKNAINTIKKIKTNVNTSNTNKIISNKSNSINGNKPKSINGNKPNPINANKRNVNK